MGNIGGRNVFTGIIEAIGRIDVIESDCKGSRLFIEAGKLKLVEVNSGDSISTSGVCLTATEFKNGGFWADVSPETAELTTLGDKQVGDHVNLEKSMTLSTPLGGHLVSGHVDGIGHIVEIEKVARFWRVVVAAPDRLVRYIAVKGSICIDGTSLTVNKIDSAQFEITIIPQTWEETVFSVYSVGSAVNLEVDLIARYVERLMSNDDIPKDSHG